MNARTDIPTEARADFVAAHKVRVARTIGELQQRARDVREHLSVLQQHQQKAYREDVTAVLHDLGYSLETGSRAVIYFAPMCESQWAEELMALGAAIQKFLPRKYSAILASVRLDLKRCVVSFELPSEEVDPLSLDGAAA